MPASHNEGQEVPKNAKQKMLAAVNDFVPDDAKQKMIAAFNDVVPADAKQKILAAFNDLETFEDESEE